MFASTHGGNSRLGPRNSEVVGVEERLVSPPRSCARSTTACADSGINSVRRIAAGRSPSRHVCHSLPQYPPQGPAIRSKQGDDGAALLRNSSLKRSRAPASGAMARPPGGGQRRRVGRRDGEAGGGEGVRKGPWMAEEDAVLLEHVRTHGPHDWSSIRSKGLLPRTGKSCRLRWVNKLRPDLKTGCKFSAEEERVVLELQAQFGNKWARIATYLPGRTDNDVKNFWSTRQKRLARLLRAPLPARSRRNSSGKAPASSSLESRPAAVGPCLDQVPFESSSSGVHPCSAAAPFMDAQNAALVTYDHASSGLLSFDAQLQQIAHPTSSHACSSSNAAPMLPKKLLFDEPPYPLLDYPGMPERWNMAPGFVNAGAMDDLAYHGLFPMMQSTSMIFPFFGTEHAQDGVKAEPPDAPDFFDDLPLDMFDSLDQVPPPLSPPATSSGF